MKRFTKKQLEVMKILWAADSPLIASDIVKKSLTLNINTTQACLCSLIANNSIKVANIVHSGTVLTRSYSPIITKEEYLGNACLDIMGNGQKKLLIASLIDANTNLDELEELEKIISYRKEQLQKEGR